MDILDAQTVVLPRSWTKRFASERLLAQVRNKKFWPKGFLPTLPAGRDLLKAHEDLFQLLDYFDAEYRLTQNEEGNFMALPSLPQNQGIALTQGKDASVEVSAYLYPATFVKYKEDIDLSFSVHFPVARGKGEEFLALVKKLWPSPSPEPMAVIPFSMKSAAVLYGNFLDDREKTRHLCFEAVREDEERAMENCKIFLDTMTAIGAWTR